MDRDGDVDRGLLQRPGHSFHGNAKTEYKRSACVPDGSKGSKFKPFFSRASPRCASVAHRDGE